MTVVLVCGRCDGFGELYVFAYLRVDFLFTPERSGPSCLALIRLPVSAGGSWLLSKHLLELVACAVHHY